MSESRDYNSMTNETKSESKTESSSITGTDDGETCHQRPSWDEYFLGIAHLVAQRATCDRKLVGAVLVNPNRRIVATGYNGAPAGMPHCDDVGHLLKDIDGRKSCIRTLHAESNALDYAGQAAFQGTLYVTVSPCYDCAKRIVNSGIVRVVVDEYYQSRNSQLVEELFSQAGVQYSVRDPGILSL